MPDAQPPTHSEPVADFLANTYAPAHRQFAWRNDWPGGFAAWQNALRAALFDRLGLTQMAIDLGDPATRSPADIPVEFGAIETRDGYRRQRCSIETEPGVRIAFWLLTPNETDIHNATDKSAKPRPLAILPHGHGESFAYVGDYHSEYERQRIIHECRDVAVQAVRRGFIAIAPDTRGLASTEERFRIDDITNKHAGRHCVAHHWQVMLAGRTAVGERVWDLMRILDVALAWPAVDTSRVLMLGNSGGGMATLHTAACDPRVTVVVPSCAFNRYVGDHLALRHCACNMIPGMLRLGEMWDIAGLVAPRPLLTVNGRDDALHPVHEVDDAAARLAAIYEASETDSGVGAGDRYAHRWGEGGHQFYPDHIWPWVEANL